MSKAKVIQSGGAISRVDPIFLQPVYKVMEGEPEERGACFTFDEFQAIKSSLEETIESNEERVEEISKKIEEVIEGGGVATKQVISAFRTLLQGLEEDEKIIARVRDVIETKGDEPFLCTPNELSIVRGMSKEEVQEEQKVRGMG